MLDWFRDDDGAPAASSSSSRPDRLAELPTGPRAASRSVVNIFGASGMGKTTLAAELYARAIARGVSATFLDTTGTNAYLARIGQARGVHCAAVETVEGWLAHVRAAARARRRYNIVLRRSFALDLSPRAPFWALVAAAGNCALCVDEMETYATARTVLDRSALGELISQGRHTQVSLISTVRTPPELHNAIKAVADVTVSFRQPRAAYAEQIAGDVMGDAVPGLARLLQRLPRFHALEYHAATGRLYRRVVTPRAWH